MRIGGFEADLIAGAVRLIRTKILKACSDKLLILLVFENSGYQPHCRKPFIRLFASLPLSSQ